MKVCRGFENKIAKEPGARFKAFLPVLGESFRKCPRGRTIMPGRHAGSQHNVPSAVDGERVGNDAQ
jgi:hypothetical protein